MKQIIIGREGNQPFTIKDEYVSRQHAIFTYDETTGIMSLKDRSRSGTFIRMGNQFQQINQCDVNATTEVRLGPYFIFRIGQLFQKTVQGAKAKPPKTQPPKEEKVDIAYLRKVAENFENTKLKLEQKQATINGLRMLSLGGSLAGGVITPLIIEKVGDNPPVFYKLIGPLVAFIFLLVLMVYCNKASKEITLKRNKNDKNYKINFCCPKCHVPFSGKLYENLLAEGKCPKCKVEFYDSKI